MKTAALITVLALATCEDKPGPEHPPFVLVDGCTRACGNLYRLGCPEATNDAGVSCETACRAMREIRTVDTQCLESAESKEAVRACQGVRCR